MSMQKSLFCHHEETGDTERLMNKWEIVEQAKRSRKYSEFKKLWNAFKWTIFAYKFSKNPEKSVQGKIQSEIAEGVVKNIVWE